MVFYALFTLDILCLKLEKQMFRFSYAICCLLLDPYRKMNIVKLYYFSGFPVISDPYQYVIHTVIIIIINYMRSIALIGLCFLCPEL